MPDLIELSPSALALAASLMLISVGLSLWLRLNMERRLLIASLRSLIQLTLLGYLLVPVFRWLHPGLTGSIVLLMFLLASREAVRRSSKRYRGIWRDAFISLFLGSALSALVGCVLVISADPWWHPRYLIPFLGMILGNSMTGISLGFDRCLSSFDQRREQVEGLLAFGATPFEASRPILQEAARTAMLPIINTMSVVGLVSIPGMMTGQILGGTPPEQAARYQILILFLIAAAISLGVGIALLFSLSAAFDKEQRLRPEHLYSREG